MTTETKTDLQLKTTRQFRRLRWQFKKTLTQADRRRPHADRPMRLAGTPVATDARRRSQRREGGRRRRYVRSANAAIRAMKVLAERGAQTKGPKRPYGLADIQAALAEGRDDEDDES